ncbi:Glycosylphosphatidylinositol:protein transamidase, GAA1 component [Decorospora gaudefroyi]|uniref:Glycosylphosphatidylinositol:protein transamidase, GAA1 component n=1 Tax=Decorospora gaudefroyi TaxID=184978 RepID=A0A6A5KPQ8_9PLEO|nr:Glycosylphosphatidylinositol:protein transamidase, GAA1 component [Decorospora gaudefroyi]
MALFTSILALRHDKRILRLPPYLSALCVIIGIGWLLVLPLDEYSRRTYISENAILPGQVHTYFGGSEHNVFRAYRHEVHGLIDKGVAERSERLSAIFHEQNLKVATQHYNYTVSNRTIANENVYAILQGPRADATEAIVLIGAWKNMADEVNNSGVALVLTLARYFKRWSLWSKDIIFLIPGDSTIGPQAWVDAYHDGHDERYVESLKIKSGALQAAVAVDYPAGPWGHRYDKLHVVYDGINGQLPNLDLFNTAVHISSSQMGVGSVIQRMWDHKDTYKDRLQTMLRGMLSQGLGHATGPHSSFIPYHVDAITLVTVGNGYHDEITLGKTLESLFRSLNNLLEHLHQSFFFYLLLQHKRFVSIGTYLPSAMLIAINFSITAMALWVKSGRSPEPIANPASTQPKNPAFKTPAEKQKDAKTAEEEDEKKEKKDAPPRPTTLIEKNGSQSIHPTASTQISERTLLTPLLLLLTAHTIGLLPLYTFNNWHAPALPALYITTANLTTLLPLIISFLLFWNFPTILTPHTLCLLQSFSLLLLGMFLAALATLNFSLSVIVGSVCVPLSFVRRTRHVGLTAAQMLGLALLNPCMVVQMGTKLLGVSLAQVLVQGAVGWHVWGLWTQVVVWLVWFPAWLVGAVVVASGMWE